MKAKAWIGRLILIGAAILQVAQFALLCIIFNHSEELGYFFLPTIIALLASMIFTLSLILRKRELQYLRGYLGDEQFFAKFPKEKKREMRRLEKARREKKASDKKYPHEL